MNIVLFSCSLAWNLGSLAWIFILLWRNDSLMNEAAEWERMYYNKKSELESIK